VTGGRGRATGKISKLSLRRRLAEDGYALQA
jgi:hypothetical protein